MQIQNQELIKRAQGQGRADAATGAHPELRGMTYDQGAAALAPEHGAGPEAATKKPFTAAVVQYTPSRFESDGSESPAYITFSGGKNRGVTAGTKVVCGGANGRVVEVYASRARAVFYGTLVNPKDVEVRLGETWSRAREDTLRQQRQQEAAKQDEKRYTDEYKTRK
ncbi:MAG: hypothetical protein IT385_14550 [Deltaproteobacteria bacterium]|nr:hypothetical protein [Deltaproteobacteria bacterium]